jgi:UPF0755 protein
MRLIKTFAFLFTLVIVFGGAVEWTGWRAYNAPGPLTDHAVVTVARGEGVNAIAADLSRARVINHRLLFIAAARLSDKARLLKAGEYDFPAGVTMARALDMIAKGEVMIHRVTIPEGLTSWQAVQIINSAPDLSGEITAIPPDGSLLPQTYTFQRGDTRQSIIGRMQAAMTKTVDDAWDKRDMTVTLSKAEAVILASIVEKETGVAAERARVAGVFLNRLLKGMPLQSDPTVIYGLTKGEIQQSGQGPLGRHITAADLQTDSPYNTYKHPGLPPGPIANPGEAAIEAVLMPEHNDYLYFVADGSGGHVFAKTLEEHNKNVAHWREVRKQ